jgi:hypothetical protein
MADMGRPLKFTPEIRTAIIQDISDAIPYQLAAESNGISEGTLYDWLKHGLKDLNEGIESEYANFSKAIKKVEKERIKRHSDKVSDNVDRWQADAWMLERRWYKHYGANVHLHELEDRMKKVESDTSEKS